MKKIITLCLMLITALLASQTKNFDYKAYVKSLDKAKEYKYKEYLKEYDKAIKRYPLNLDLKIQKCEFINYSYYDEYEGYSLNYEEYEKCISSLYNKYPNKAEIILLKVDNTYGDSLKIILQKAEKFIDRKPYDWNSIQKAKLLYSLASNSYNEDKNFIALKYLNKAKKLKDTIDNSILAANIHIAANNKEKALAEITEKIDLDVETWKLNKKAELLLKLDAPDKALEVYKRVEEKDSLYVDNAGLAETFEDLKQYDFAREYLVKDTVNEWTRLDKVVKLAKFDLKYSDAETALKSYRKVQKNNFYDDFWGVKRLKLFFKDATLNWSFNEFLYVVILVLTIGVFFISPYVLILPIHFLGKQFKLKPEKLSVPFDWKLRHFWLLVFAYLSIDFILQLFFDYQGFVDSWFSDYISEEVEVLVNTKHHIAYFSLMFISVMLFLNKERILHVFRSNIPVLRTISLFVLFMVLNMALVRVLKSSSLIAVPLSIGEEIKEIIREHGFWLAFLFVVVLVPIYEEVIFRGVILSSVEKHLGFWKANIIQAILFALLHQNFTLFIFYLFFAIATGLIVRKSKGLLTGILFHAGNNFIFLIVVYRLVLNESFLQNFS